MLAGNHVFRAARELGFSEIAATFVDLSEQEALKLVLVDNRTSDLAGYDDALLLELLEGLGDLSGTGFDEAALDDLLTRWPRRLMRTRTSLQRPESPRPAPATSTDSATIACCAATPPTRATSSAWWPQTGRRSCGLTRPTASTRGRRVLRTRAPEE